MKTNRKTLKEVHSDEITQGANVHLYYKDSMGVTITSVEKWLIRLWLLVSNPFRYIFTGRVRY